MHKLTSEEKELLRTYRAIKSRWERFAFLLLMQSIVSGRYTATADRRSLDHMSRMVGMGKWDREDSLTATDAERLKAVRKLDAVDWAEIAEQIEGMRPDIQVK